MDTPRKANILIVDDSPTIRLATKTLIEAPDREVVCVESGEAALRVLLSIDFAVILMDVNLPGMNGFQIASLIRKRERSSKTPVIFVTGTWTTEEAKAIGYQSGAVDYLLKPVDNAILKSKVAVFVELAKQRDELKLLNEQLVAKNRELEAAYKRLKVAETDLVQSEKMTALNVLSEGVAHGINNPLSFAKGSLAVVYRDFDKIKSGEGMRGEKRSEILSEMERSLHVVELGLNRSETIVKNLSSFVQGDTMEKGVDIEACLDSTLTLCPPIGLSGIMVGREYKVARPIEGIPSLLHYAFMNVFLNAIQAIKEKGNIFIKTHENTESVVISIKDTGVGIPEANLPKIFEPFFTTREEGEGTGLGLSITYKIIVVNHHGKIAVKSKEGEGTEVIITLPFTQPIAQPTADPKGAAS